MKTKMKWMAIAAVAMLAMTGLMSCNCKPAAADATPDDSLATDSTLLMAIDRYLIDSIGAFYAPGQLCIPCYDIVAIADSADAGIKVWGDFWVFNYNIAGDTLKTVSGGSHPGLMHIAKKDKVYVVTAFDVVLDGSENLPSAKRIFGDKYEAFHAINSDEAKREATRARALALYTKRNDLPVKFYQDYGWPAKPIFKDSKD